MAIYLGDLELATGGGGATGTGLPVNSYKSFLVKSAGNPTGYDATTGLYTHPNGDYWLKTGNTLSGVTSTYPDAITTRSETPFSTFTATGNTVPYFSSRPYFDGNGTFWTFTNASSPPYIATERSYYTGAATGNTLRTVSLTGGGIPYGAYDPFNGEYYITHDGPTYAVERFDATTFASIGTFTGPYTTMRGMGVRDANSILFVSTSGTTAAVYNNAGVVQPSLTLGASIVNGTNTFTVSYSESLIYMKNSATTISQLSAISGAVLGTITGTFPFTSQGIFASSTNGTLFEEYTEYGNPATETGDGTFRRDTDSGQPLFIKIK